MSKKRHIDHIKVRLKINSNTLVCYNWVISLEPERDTQAWHNAMFLFMNSGYPGTYLSVQFYLQIYGNKCYCLQKYLLTKEGTTESQLSMESDII